MIRVDTDDLANSAVVLQAKMDTSCFYPFIQYYRDGELAMSYTVARQHIRLAEFGPVGYGKAGSFEGYCSGNGIAQLGQMLAKENFQMGKSVSYCEDITQLDEITAKKIAQCAEQGCPDALKVFAISGKMLGKGLSILIDLLNPQKIVIGSIFQRSGHLLRDAMEEVIRKECLTAARDICQIVPAQLEENIGDYAALAVASMACK